MSLSLTSNVLSGRVKVGSVSLVPQWTQMLSLGSTGQIGAIGLVDKSLAVRYCLFGTFIPFLPRSCQALMVLEVFRINPIKLFFYRREEEA